MPKIIYFKPICKYYNDLLTGYFRIDKTQELIGRKDYWPSLSKDVKFYMRGCDIFLASKAVKFKLYGDIQSLPILTY